MRYLIKQSNRQTISLSNGFSAVELLITLFIAAAFLISGFQLYAVVIKDGGEVRMSARAANAATDYLQRYKSNVAVKNPCESSTPLSDSAISVTGLSNTTVSVAITCPYAAASPTATECTGGTASYDGLYTVRKFTTGTSTLTCPAATSAQILVVGSGGGGGVNAGAGGGGGAVILAKQTLSSGTPYTVTIGASGSRGVSASNYVGGGGGIGGSTIFGTITATGGGGGGAYSSMNGTGGANGGGGGDPLGAGGVGTVPTLPSGVTGSVFAGYTGGAGQNAGHLAGGGAGAGGNAILGIGGPGAISDIDGKAYYYGGGGGGGTWVQAGKAGGIGGGGGGGDNGLGGGAGGGSAINSGGNGSSGANLVNTGNGGANTGGGGGGGTFYGSTGSQGGLGGSGIVIVRYLTPTAATNATSKITVTLKYGNPQQTVSNSTYVGFSPITTNGLVLNLDAGNSQSIKGRNSIINWNSWTVSAGGTSDYSANGDGNSRIMDTNPWGVSDIVWDVSNQDAASDADGGWNGSAFSIDNTKTYRFSTWVRRKTIGDGLFYLGTSGGPAAVLNRSDAVANGNPYFTATGWWGNANQWYLVVGYVWPAGSGAGANRPESGIYSLDGTKVASTGDFIWQSGTTASNHRSYLYYSTNTATNQQWYQPRVDLVDGTEPSIAELRTNGGNTWTDLSGNGNNGTINGPTYSNATNGGIFNFDGTNDYVVVPKSLSTAGYAGVSVETWLKTSSSNSAIMVVQWAGSMLYLNRFTTGKAFVGYDGSSGNNSASDESISTVNNNQWHHIVGTNDGTTTRIYVDNNLDKFYTDALSSDTSVVYIGSNAGTQGFLPGAIGATRLYNRALSASEVTQNFNALRGRYGL